MSASYIDAKIITRRYAGALLDLAENGKATDSVDSDIKKLQTLITDSSAFSEFLSNPSLSRAQQLEAVENIGKELSLHQLTSNFLGVIVMNKRLYLLSAILEAFDETLREKRGEIEADVETAFALTDMQTKELQKELSDVMGSNVTLNVNVNKDLLGGLVVTVGSKMFDSSVKNKLERLGQAMTSNLNQEKEVG